MHDNFKFPVFHKIFFSILCQALSNFIRDLCKSKLLRSYGSACKLQEIFIRHLKFIIKFKLSIELDSNIYLPRNILFANLKGTEHIIQYNYLLEIVVITISGTQHQNVNSRNQYFQVADTKKHFLGILNTLKSQN